MGCGTGVCGACSVILERRSGAVLHQEDEAGARVQRDHSPSRASAPPSTCTPCSRPGSPTAAPSAASAPRASSSPPTGCCRRTRLPPAKRCAPGSRPTTTSAAAPATNPWWTRSWPPPRSCAARRPWPTSPTTSPARPRSTAPAIPGPTALAKVTGLADYGDDVALQMPPGVAHLAVVLAEAHHANIISIDTAEAEAMPGVIKVHDRQGRQGHQQHARARCTSPRHEGQRRPAVPGHRRQEDLPPRRRGGPGGRRHPGARPRGRQEGQAEPGGAARLHDLPRSGHAQRHPAPRRACPTSTWSSRSSRARTRPSIFETAPFVAEGSFHSQHEPHLPIEPDVCQAYWGTDGMMTIQCKCQNLSENREVVAHGLRHPQGEHPHAC